jgi:serine/threonine protein kinase
MDTPDIGRVRLVRLPAQPKKPHLQNLFNFVKELIQRARSGEEQLKAIQNYDILKLIGKGGFGEVYLAQHKDTGEFLALKIMLPEIAATQSVANLMQRQRGKLSVDEAIPIILQVLDGLEYAHKAEIPYVRLADGTFGKGRGLVHRDIKPDNIFLINVNDTRIAKIGDYGLSKAFDVAGLSGQTMTGDKAGSPWFMPRQQVIDFKYAKPEVDVWAVAASLYYMLTNFLPRDFGQDDPFITVLTKERIPIRDRDKSIPKKLAEVIDLALIDKPDIHFKSAADFKQALLSVI